MKKITLVVLVLLLFSGCYFYACTLHLKKRMVKLPSLSRAYQIQVENSFPDPWDVSKVILIFYNRWVLEFGDENQKVFDTLNSIMIEWRDETREGHGRSLLGQPVSGVIRGMAIAPGYIWVWKDKYKRISSTSLVHELVHCALWSNNPHNDPDHEGEEYEGWTQKHTEFMFEINYLLEDMNM